MPSARGMSPVRLTLNALGVLVILGGIFLLAKTWQQNRIDGCVSSTVAPSKANGLELLERLSACIESSGSFIDSIIPNATRESLSVLSVHPSELAGAWKSSQSRCSYEIYLAASGTFDAEPVKCDIGTRRFSGIWGSSGARMVWYYDRGSGIWRPDVNSMEVESKDKFILLENDGSRTEFTRLGAGVAVAHEGGERSAASAESVLPLAEGVSRLPFAEVAPFPNSVAVSSDGSTVAHITMDGSIQIWNASDQKLVESIPGGGKQPSSVALNGDGSKVAVGYFDSRVVIWSRREQKAIQEFNGTSGKVFALAFSNDERLLAAGSDDGTTRLWEAATRKQRNVFDSQYGVSFDEREGGGVVSVGFSGDDRALYVNEWSSNNYESGRLTTVWDIDDGIEITTRVGTPPNSSDDGLRTGHALGGGGWLLAYSGHSGLMIERIDQCEDPRQMSSGQFAETVVADPQGRWTAASDGERLTFFGVSEAGSISRAVALPGRPIAFAAHSGGQALVALVHKAAQSDGDVHFLDNRNAETEARGVLYQVQVPEPYRNLKVLRVNKDARHCPATDATRTKQDYRLPVKPIALKVVRQFSALEPQKGWPTFPEPDGVLAEDRSAMKLDVDTGDVYRLAEGYIERFGADGRRYSDVKIKGGVYAIAVRNGRLAALYINGDLEVWELQARGNSKIYKSFIQLNRDAGDIGEIDLSTSGIGELALSADGRYLKMGFENPSGDSPATYATYRIDSSERIGHGELLTPFPSRANRAVVSDTRPHHLAVLDFDRGGVIARLPRQPNFDQYGATKRLLVTISVDGKLVGSASSDGLVRLWDIDKHRMLGEARVGGEITAMQFDEQSRHLAAKGANSQVTVFRIPVSANQ